MLHFPAAVEVRNVRLELCKHCLVFVALWVILFNFIFLARFTIDDPITGHVETKVIGMDSWDKMNSETNRAMTSPLCTEPQRYSFWADSAGSVRFDNFSCLELCPEGRAAPNCINQYALFFEESKASSVIFTSLKDTSLYVPGSSMTQKDGHYFVPASNALSLEIMYTLELGSKQYSSFRDTPTKILKSDGTVWKYIEKAKGPVVISFTDLLSLAGTSLDAARPAVGRNYFPKVQGSSWPASRVVGLTLSIEVVCLRGGGNIKAWTEAAPPWEVEPQIECELRVKEVPSLMVTVPRVEPDSGTTADTSTKIRMYNGVRVIGDLHGKYKKVNLNSLLLNLTTTLTVMRVPNEIIFVFAMLCLGHLSRIYRAAVHREFNISKECAAMSLRLIAHSYIFSEMQNHMAKDGSFENGIIDEVSMTQMWTRIIRNVIPDESSAGEMASFFIHQIASSFQNPLSQDASLKGSLYEMWLNFVDGINATAADLNYNKATQLYAAQGHTTKIDMDKFEAALSSAEPISFGSLVRLFDQNRQASSIEKFFTPVQLRICLQKAKNDRLIREERHKVEMVLQQRAPEGEPHDLYISARHEMSLLQEQVQGMRYKMSEVEKQLLELGEDLNRQDLTVANSVTNVVIEPASGFVSRAEFNSQCLEIMEFVDSRFKLLQDEFRTHRDEVVLGMDRVASRTLSGTQRKEKARSAHQVGAAGCDIQKSLSGSPSVSTDLPRAVHVVG